MDYDNINNVINEKNVKCNTLLDLGLYKIKSELDEEEIKMQGDVLENQLEEESGNNVSTLQNGAFPESCRSGMFCKDNLKFEYVEVKSEINEKLNASLELCNVKCEFDEDESKIQYGILENQLNEERVDNSSTNMIKSHDNVFPGNFLKTEPKINDIFSTKDVKIEFDAVKIEINEKNEEFPLDLESSKIKCEFEEEETKIQYGVLENQLQKPSKIPPGEIHERICTREMGFKCETCSHCFSRKNHLIVHMRIHTGEKPYKCETCCQCFSRKGSLITHMKIHTGEKLHECETCGKSFTEKKSLNRHILSIHIGEKPFKCEICGKRFKHKISIIHMRSHTTKKPF